MENRKACDVMRGRLFVSAHSLRIPPLTRAVSSGGSLRAIGVDSHGLSLEVGIRASPHIGVTFINGRIEVKVMQVTLLMGPGLVI